MRFSISFIFLFIFILCIQQSFGVFFYLKEGQKKCFIEDLPEHTIVIVEIEASDIPINGVVPGEPGEFTRRKNADTQPLGITGDISYQKDIIMEHTIPVKGRFAFTSQEPG